MSVWDTGSQNATSLTFGFSPTERLTLFSRNPSSRSDWTYLQNEESFQPVIIVRDHSSKIKLMTHTRMSRVKIACPHGDATAWRGKTKFLFQKDSLIASETNLTTCCYRDFEKTRWLSGWPRPLPCSKVSWLSHWQLIPLRLLKLTSGVKVWPPACVCIGARPTVKDTVDLTVRRCRERDRGLWQEGVNISLTFLEGVCSGARISSTHGLVVNTHPATGSQQRTRLSFHTDTRSFSPAMRATKGEGVFACFVAC